MGVSCQMVSACEGLWTAFFPGYNRDMTNDVPAGSPEGTSDALAPPSLVSGAVFQARLSANPRGFAFAPAPDGGPDVFIAPTSRGGAQHGELVQVELARVRHDGRREGVVQAVLSPPAMWVGVVQEHGGRQVLSPQDPRFPWVALPLSPAVVGDWVVVELSRRGAWQAEEQCKASLLEPIEEGLAVRVVEVSSPNYQSRAVSRLQAALAGFRVHSDDDCRLAETLSARPMSQSPWTYEDLRHIPFMTIDGDSTKDFDDALWAEALPEGGFRLWVAIADVAAYISKGSSLDQEARSRATSAYLPGLVLPMLPPALSEGACSLNPGVDRPAMVLRLDIDRDGRHVDSCFQAALIHSHARLTYAGATHWLAQGGKQGPSLPSAVGEGLSVLGRLTDLLLEDRRRRGALDFDRSEYRLAFTGEGVVRGVYRPSRTQAHRLVEECMVAANVAAARYLRQRGLPLLSRHHPPLNPQRLSALLCHHPEAKTDTAFDVAKLIQDRPELLPFIRIATGAAEYTPHNSGHFGLALDEYAHFTSPIRRYPDILVHRAIHVALGNLPLDALDEHWTTLGLVSTERERAATVAERTATELLRVEWLARELEVDRDRSYAATIDSATPAGAFLTLDACGASGLLRPPAGSEFVAAAKVWRLPDGSEWVLGGCMDVKIAAVDVRSARISLDRALPAEDCSPSGPRSPLP